MSDECTSGTCTHTTKGQEGEISMKLIRQSCAPEMQECFAPRTSLHLCRAGRIKLTGELGVRCSCAATAGQSRGRPWGDTLNTPLFPRAELQTPATCSHQSVLFAHNRGLVDALMHRVKLTSPRGGLKPKGSETEVVGLRRGIVQGDCLCLRRRRCLHAQGVSCWHSQRNGTCRQCWASRCRTPRASCDKHSWAHTCPNRTHMAGW
jgi:hypothetical protein